MRPMTGVAVTDVSCQGGFVGHCHFTLRTLVVVDVVPNVVSQQSFVGITAGAVGTLELLNW